ncbi:hypothetical protein KY289_000897 [Solanum tuberosum]|nr:hypothetical protein KY289_000897 [Solanum tuberosum]
MIFPVAQVPSISLEPSKSNTQVGNIKGYDFSNPVKLGERRDEVIGYHVATPRLGFILSEPLQISSKKGKGIASSHHTSIEKTRESKEDWVARMKGNHLNKWTDMPPPQRPLYFITWELNGSHYQKGGCWSTKIKIFVKRITIVVTNQFHGETKKEEDEAITVFWKKVHTLMIQLMTFKRLPLNWRMAYNQP